jgi:hypothetical protein
VDLSGVADYIEFYSRSMSEAAPHAELSAFDKLAIYARMLAARAGLGPPVELRERVPQRVLLPFEETVTVVQEFPLPNNPDSAVTIYRLNDNFGVPQ